jgi:hypothetical protein
MNALDLALAVVLLTAPPDNIEINNSAAVFRLVAPTLKALALQWELLDAREIDCLKNARDFAADVKLLQGRYQEMHAAPLVADVERFPGRDLVNDMLAFNQSFRTSITNRLDLDMVHADDLRTIISETDLLYRVYDALRDARSECYFVTYRRQALAQLRDLVGVEAFYTGQLPPHVPLWRIPEARE